MSGDIQFEKAQFASGDHCVACQNPLGHAYFRLNGNTVCASCAEKAKFDFQMQMAQSGGLFRAVLFGAGAALAGAIIYALVAALTGYEFALIAIFIGWMVGKAMMRGSRGIGGRRFQVAAVLITYLAITAGYIPSIVRELSKLDPQENAAPKDEAAEAKDPAKTDEPANTQLSAGGIALALALILAIAAAAPFLSLTAGVSGLLTIVIVGVGLMQAWKETREQPFAISGPFPYEPKKTAESESPG